MKMTQLRLIVYASVLTLNATLFAETVLFSESFEGSPGEFFATTDKAHANVMYTTDAPFVTDGKQAIVFTEMPGTEVGGCNFYKLLHIDTNSSLPHAIAAGNKLSFDVTTRGFDNTTGSDHAYAALTLSTYEASNGKFSELYTKELNKDKEGPTTITYTFTPEDAAKFNSGEYVMLSINSNYGGWRNGASGKGAYYIDNLKITSE